MPRLTFTLLLLLLAGPAWAQTDAPPPEDEECSVDQVDFASAFAEPDTTAPPPYFGGGTPSALTEAEQAVQARIAEPGIHVVHFWAPWCNNSLNELYDGWGELIAEHEDVSFTFVTIWNDGESGEETLVKYRVPTDRVLELTQPDLGPSDVEDLRRRSFLGLPVTWIPSTWIFHNGGELAFALNYGEMSMDVLDRLILATERAW